MKTASLLLTASLSTSLLLSGPSAYALDTDPSPKEEEIANLSPRVSATQVAEQIEDASILTGIAAAEIEESMLKEVKQKTAAASPASAPIANLPIGNAPRRGDVYYTPAWTSGYNHGHVGIYSQTNRIVEALQNGVIERPTSIVRVSSGSVKQYVRTSPTNRNRAAQRAREYVGKAYNMHFYNNRKTYGPMNCSQVVWAAYKSTAGIDIDIDEGWGVYPTDVRDSGYTVSYKWF